MIIFEHRSLYTRTTLRALKIRTLIVRTVPLMFGFRITASQNMALVTPCSRPTFPLKRECGRGIKIIVFHHRNIIIMCIHGNRVLYVVAEI